MPYKIRDAKLSDAKDFVRIYSPYVLNAPISFELSVPTEDDFRGRIESVTKNFPWILCETGNFISGYAYANTFRTRPAYNWSVECTVYVSQDFHRQGIARALYTELFARLKKKGLVNIIAGVTLPNEASVRLHESMGFRQVGIFKDLGFKMNQWWDVGFWQLQLQRPEKPENAS
jgi:L-amino acid N-acyltransferase YncA